MVTPLLKKSTLYPNELKHFWPVSNLAFVSKVMEKVMCTRLQKHLADNNLDEPYQSAYQTGHSIETAMLRVHNDIQCALGDNKCMLLVFIDLSAAFDTVFHRILLDTLQPGDIWYCP